MYPNPLVAETDNKEANGSLVFSVDVQEEEPLNITDSGHEWWQVKFATDEIVRISNMSTFWPKQSQ